MNHSSLWVVLLGLVGIFAFMRLAGPSQLEVVPSPEIIEDAETVLTEANLNGELIRVEHSALDIGQAQDLFDQNPSTLIRGMEANPLILDFEFETPKALTGLGLDFGSMDFKLRVQVFGAEDNQLAIYESEYLNQPPDPHVDLEFVKGPALITSIYMEIEQLNPPDEVHIHVREVSLQE